jgi:hypothetical protein
LRNRLLCAGIELKNFYLSVFYMNKIPDSLQKEFKSDELVVLLEDIITRLGPSAFVRRLG